MVRSFQPFPLLDFLLLSFSQISSDKAAINAAFHTLFIVYPVDFSLKGGG